MKKYRSIALWIIVSFVVGIFPIESSAADIGEGLEMMVTSHISDTEKVDTEGMSIVDLGVEFSAEETNQKTMLESIADTSNGRSDLPANLAGLLERTSMMAMEIEDDFAIGSVTDYITTEQSFKGLYPFYTYPGELLQAQLQGPESLDIDYDLYLFKFDMNTGDLINTPIDICAYNTTSLPAIPEGVGDVNNLNVDQAYAIMVYSKKGCSAEIPFTLTISVTKKGVYNSEESNDSSFKSTGFSQDIGPESEFTISDVNLNSPIDNDWYAFNIPSTLDFNEIDIQITGDADVEIYKAVSGATLEKYRRSQSQGYYIGRGTIYVRVFPKGRIDFGNQKKEYSLDISVQQYKLTQIGNEFLCKGEPWKRQNYSQGGDRYAFLDSSVLEWNIYYMSPSGYLCKNIQDNAYMQMIDDAWDNPAIRMVTSDLSFTKDGKTTITMKIMPGRGQWTDLTLYYDYDVYLTMYSDKAGFIAEDLPVYITSQIR